MHLLVGLWILESDFNCNMFGLWTFIWKLLVIILPLQLCGHCSLLYNALQCTSPLNSNKYWANLLFYYCRMKETFYEILHLVFHSTLKVNLCTLLLWQPSRKTRILVKWDSNLYLRSKSSLLDCTVIMNTAALNCPLAFKKLLLLLHAWAKRTTQIVTS